MAKKDILHVIPKNCVIHCPTEADDNTVRQALKDANFHWADTTPMTKSFWNDYKEETCIDPFEQRYCRRSYYENNKRKVISVTQFLNYLD